MKTITYNPETHRLVPVEPTVAIRIAIYQSLKSGELSTAIYRAMLSAAPQPEPVEVEPVLYAEFSEDGGWLGEASEYQDHLEEPIALYTAPPDYEALRKHRDDLQHTICEWEDANAKGGWIDELRQHARGELGRACEDRRQLLHALRNIAGMPCLSKEARAMSKFAIVSLKAVRGVAADIPSDARGWEQAAAHYRGDDCYIDAALASVKGGAA